MSFLWVIGDGDRLDSGSGGSCPELETGFLGTSIKNQSYKDFYHNPTQTFKILVLFTMKLYYRPSNLKHISFKNIPFHSRKSHLLLWTCLELETSLWLTICAFATIFCEFVSGCEFVSYRFGWAIWQFWIIKIRNYQSLARLQSNRPHGLTFGEFVSVNDLLVVIVHDFGVWTQSSALIHLH